MEDKGVYFFKFSITCDRTKNGETVHISGNHINNWDITKSLELKTCKNIYPKWESDIVGINTIQDKPFEYKYLIKIGNEILRWEEIKGNRTIHFIDNNYDNTKNFINVSEGNFGCSTPQIVSIGENLSLLENSKNSVKEPHHDEIIITEENIQTEVSDLNKLTCENFYTHEEYDNIEPAKGSQFYKTEPSTPTLNIQISSNKQNTILDLDESTNFNNNRPIKLNDDLMKTSTDKSSPSEEPESGSLIDSIQEKNENQETYIYCSNIGPQIADNVVSSSESPAKNNEPQKNDEKIQSFRSEEDKSPIIEQEKEFKSPKKGSVEIGKKDLEFNINVNIPQKSSNNQTNETPNPSQEHNNCCCVIF